MTEAIGAIEVDSAVILVAEIAADLVVLRLGLEAAALADRLLDSEAAADLVDLRVALEVVLVAHRAVSLEALAAAIAKADSAQ